MRTLLLTSTLILVCATFAACGDDDDDSDDGGADSPATQPAAATQPAGGSTPSTSECCVTLTAVDFAYEPAPGFEVVTGAPFTLTLENEGESPHTLTVYEDEAFETPVDGADTGQVEAGESGEFTFDSAGEAYFRCEVHPTQMQGEITITTR
jgi:plastocyanin